MDKKYTHYVTPAVPVYAYRCYAINHEEVFREGADIIYGIENIPVLAFGCWYSDDGYNASEALILWDGGFLIPAVEEGGYLGCSYDPDLSIEDFKTEIELIKEKNNKRR